MNMKKITGILMMTAAVIASGDAAAGLILGTTQVPIKIEVTGAMGPIDCSFDRLNVTSNMPVGTVLGHITCRNPNAATVITAVLQGSGTSDGGGIITLRDGVEGAIRSKLYNEANDAVEVVPANIDSGALGAASSRVEGGGRTIYSLKVETGINGIPAGEFEGSISIGTWAA
ncbi:hypothetical protein AAH559_005400 [Salmonella enterica]